MARRLDEGTLLALFLAFFGQMGRKAGVPKTPPAPPPAASTTPTIDPSLLGQLGDLAKQAADAGAPAATPAASGGDSSIVKSSGPLPDGLVQVSSKHAPSDVATWKLSVAQALNRWEWTQDPARPEYYARREPGPAADGTQDSLVLYGRPAPATPFHQRGT